MTDFLNHGIPSEHSVIFIDFWRTKRSVKKVERCGSLTHVSALEPFVLAKQHFDITWFMFPQCGTAPSVWPRCTRASVRNNAQAEFHIKLPDLPQTALRRRGTSLSNLQPLGGKPQCLANLNAPLPQKKLTKREKKNRVTWLLVFHFVFFFLLLNRIWRSCNPNRCQRDVPHAQGWVTAAPLQTSINFSC